MTDNEKMARALRYYTWHHADNCPCYACSTLRRHPDRPAFLHPDFIPRTREGGFTVARGKMPPSDSADKAEATYWAQRDVVTR